MQIIFDSRFDSVETARHLRDMLDTYISGRINITVTNSAQISGATAAQVAAAVQRGVKSIPVQTPEYSGVGRRSSDAPLPPGMSREPGDTDIHAAVLDAPVAFTPGDMSGSAPSPADAAPVQTAPEVSTAGVPMPPTVVSVPAPPSTAPVAPAAPTTSALTVDVHGLPWDERIHASSKTRNADGSWRQRRNLSPVTLETVTAELRARGAVRQEIEGSPEMMKVVQDVGQMFAAPATDLMSGQPLPAGGYVPAPPPMAAGGTAANVPPPPVTTVAAPPAPAAPDALTYDGFLAWVTPKMMDGSTPFDKVAAALSASGVSSLQELRDNPAAIPAVYAALGGV